MESVHQITEEQFNNAIASIDLSNEESFDINNKKLVLKTNKEGKIFVKYSPLIPNFERLKKHINSNVFQVEEILVIYGYLCREKRRIN